LFIALMTVPVARAQQSDAELLARLNEMQQQIEVLKQQVAEAQGLSRENDARLEAVAEVVETRPSANDAGETTIGSYGELHYNRLEADDSSQDLDAVDYHRFVLFFGHQFNERTRFYSEFELEHSFSGDGAPGEVELEQAFVEYDLDSGHHARAGLFLLPLGILNETHEPPTFYGVERNDVESIIVPATWWEAGAALNGRWGSDWNWDLALTSGLQMPTSGSSAFRVRSGRQKVAEALASDGAVTGRLRYLGIPGLQAAISLQYQVDPSQRSGDGLDSGTLLEGHIDYQRGAFGLRALYARWDFDGDKVEAAGADRQSGWYLEPSFRLNEKVGVYTRYQDLAGFRAQDQFSQWEFGFNWWLNDNVAFKFDYRSRDHDLASQQGRNFDGIDLGVGYSF